MLVKGSKLLHYNTEIMIDGSFINLLAYVKFLSVCSKFVDSKLNWKYLISYIKYRKVSHVM